MQTRSVAETIRDHAREADDLHAQSRRLLVRSVRDGAAAGLTQKQIAEAIGRSQPEVSRLLRFHGSTPLGRSLEAARRPILTALTTAGGRNPRVFGSVSRGDDGPDSDVDLLVDFASAPSLFELARLESDLASLVGSPVDVVPSASLRPHLADRVRAEAVPL